ncbi:MAG: tyrosine--tRNA ligase [Elusimicrobiaceae bacterium]|nr:tyrosine--tRNA ligase [Elusimicrobiaceae bacterium]
MSADPAFEPLTRGCTDIVSREELEKKLGSGKQLVIKLGADPTRPDLHLGHSVVLSKMRAFEDLGHKGVLVIGDFTAGIGDPSGRDSTRPVLGPDQIRENAGTYVEQVFKILDPQRTEIRFNSEWLAPFVGGNSGAGLLATLSKVTVSQLLEREDFKKRMAENSPVSMLELLYPVFQGYDSVALKADIELGGSDQIFNLLAGRSLQKDNGQAPQVVMTMPLLVGTDGVKKMSKSYGNYIGLSDKPDEMFGKVMSVSDGLMLDYYELLTAEDMAAVKAMHPMDAKKQLAGLLVTRFHGAAQAESALEHFNQVFSRRQLPDEMPAVTVPAGTTVSAAVYAAGMAESKKEARRLVEQGGVKLNGEKVEDCVLAFEGKAVMQVGRRRFCELTIAG